MNRYAIVFHGTGFTLPAENNGTKVSGFYTTRFSSGANEEEAIQTAKEMLLNDGKIHEWFSEQIDDLKIEAEEVVEVGFLAGRLKKYGLAFYENESKHDT